MQCVLTEICREISVRSQLLFVRRLTCDDLVELSFAAAINRSSVFEKFFCVLFFPGWGVKFDLLITGSQTSFCLSVACLALQTKSTVQRYDRTMDVQLDRCFAI
jgi:hypothetical protein